MASAKDDQQVKEDDVRVNTGRHAASDVSGSALRSIFFYFLPLCGAIFSNSQVRVTRTLLRASAALLIQNCAV